MMMKSLWLSYDLGVKGDYTSLYEWLDSKGAIECGDSLAYMKHEWSSSDGPLPDLISEELSAHVELKKFGRIYMIWKEDGRVKGKFLFGTRKAAPWAGYAGKPSPVDEE
jgi:hypothetical protein